MVQPGSATVSSAASSARVPGPSAITVMPSLLPGPCGAATLTGSSAVTSVPAGSSSRRIGCRVVTPGPSARMSTGAGAPATVTRTTWHGPWPVLTNNGVDSARTIRMTSSSHGPRAVHPGGRAAISSGARSAWARWRARIRSPGTGRTEQHGDAERTGRYQGDQRVELVAPGELEQVRDQQHRNRRGEEKQAGPGGLTD